MCIYDQGKIGNMIFFLYSLYCLELIVVVLSIGLETSLSKLI